MSCAGLAARLWGGGRLAGGGDWRGRLGRAWRVGCRKVGAVPDGLGSRVGCASVARPAAGSGTPGSIRAGAWAWACLQRRQTCPLLRQALAAAHARWHWGGCAAATAPGPVHNWSITTAGPCCPAGIASTLGLGSSRGRAHCHNRIPGHCCSRAGVGAWGRRLPHELGRPSACSNGVRIEAVGGGQGREGTPSHATTRGAHKQDQASAELRGSPEQSAIR